MNYDSREDHNDRFLFISLGRERILFILPYQCTGRNKVGAMNLIHFRALRLLRDKNR